MLTFESIDYFRFVRKETGNLKIKKWVYEAFTNRIVGLIY